MRGGLNCKKNVKDKCGDSTGDIHKYPEFLVIELDSSEGILK